MRVFVWCAVAGCVLAGCAAGPEDRHDIPAAFGVTMVEETTCIGQGGRIVVGPEGAYCADL